LEDGDKGTVIEQIIKLDQEDTEAKATECYNNHQQDEE
jgi:hypothetical protein